jgi:hypothetical protein
MTTHQYEYVCEYHCGAPSFPPADPQSYLISRFFCPRAGAHSAGARSQPEASLLRNSGCTRLKKGHTEAVVEIW